MPDDIMDLIAFEEMPNGSMRVVPAHHAQVREGIPVLMTREELETVGNALLDHFDFNTRAIGRRFLEIAEMVE